MKFFLAGIMQGSLQEPRLHAQDYRGYLKDLIKDHFPEAEVYDPLADHGQSIDYDEHTGREVFMTHNRMCGTVDVVLAFLPEASMGTAIEMWEAHRHGRVVIAISPLVHNWAVKFCSHAIYPDLTSFESAVRDGVLRNQIKEMRQP